MNTRHRVTAADVAREAGVSRATVSYVLNGAQNQRISDATRTHVEAVARRLGYTPNAAARNLRAGGNRLVLVALANWPLGPRVAEAVAALVTRLEELEYQPLVLFRAGARPDSFVTACTQVQPVGVLAPVPQLTARVVRMLRAGGTAGLLAFGDTPVPTVHTLVLEQAEIGRIATQHLLDQGHRHVLHVVPATERANEVADARTEAAVELLDKVGGRLTVVRVEPSVESVRARLATALRHNPPPTAVEAFSDDTALLVYGALADLGLTVPDDVAVVGCDDSPTATLMTPPLTSIRLATESSWRDAAERLHDLIEGREVPHVLHHEPPSLLMRASSQGFRRDDPGSRPDPGDSVSMAGDDEKATARRTTRVS